MSRAFARLLTLAMVAGLVTAGELNAEDQSTKPAALFRDYVEPLLKKHCYECHSSTLR